MMNATVEKLVKAVEGRVAPKGYVVSFAETKKNNVGDKSGIQIRKKDSTIGVIVYIDGYIADIENEMLNVDRAADEIVQQIEDKAVLGGYSDAQEFAKMVKAKKAFLKM